MSYGFWEANLILQEVDWELKFEVLARKRFLLSIPGAGPGLDTSLYRHPSGSFAAGPTLPFQTQSVFVAKINDEEFILAGGYHNGIRTDCYWMNRVTGQTKQLPDLPYETYLTAGGYFNGKYMIESLLIYLFGFTF